MTNQKLFAHPEILSILYRKILTIRILESRLQSYCDVGLAGDLHFNKGQEAISVGVCAALKKTDRIVTHHRTIAHQIAAGAKLGPLVAELLGKSSGVNGGRAGEMHISDASIHHAFSFQLVGTCIPVAAGLAWALAHHHLSKDIVAVFFGDAASGNGQFHEGMNLIGVHRLPVLLVCENNHLAGNIKSSFYMPGNLSVADRAKAYQIRSQTVDGNDLGVVVKAANEARSYIETTGAPYLLECYTERLSWHKQGQRDVRSKEELSKLAESEPLVRLTKSLGSLIDVPTMRREIELEIDRAFVECVDSEPPAFTEERTDE